MDRLTFAAFPWVVGLWVIGPEVAWGLAAVGLVIMVSDCLGFEL